MLAGILVAFVAVGTCAWAAQHTGQRQEINDDPNRAKLITVDIDNFWRAYALASAASTPQEKEQIYQREYLDKGSPGLKNFIESRIRSAKNLTDAIEKHPQYYASLKTVAPQVAQMEPAIRASLRKLKDLYPDAVFPDVYFLIGVMNSGGTTGDSGLLIGTEMHGKTAQTDMSEMDSWHQAVLGPVDDLPGIVAHELIHYQQVERGTTLLGHSIREGSADFIGEMISGQTINKHLRAYGMAHEAELWKEFSQEMNGKDLSHWMYQGDQSKDRPADSGYFMGSQIAEAYYRRAADKKQAIRDILLVKDYSAFFAGEPLCRQVLRSSHKQQLKTRKTPSKKASHLQVVQNKRRWHLHRAELCSFRICHWIRNS